MTPYQAAVLVHVCANQFGTCHTVPVQVPTRTPPEPQPAQDPPPVQLQLLEAHER
jgi:hypothetical protein